MLVLSRRKSESIILSGDSFGQVEVKVVRVSGGNVRIGIEAPSNVIINRAEIQEVVNGNRVVAGQLYGCDSGGAKLHGCKMDRTAGIANGHG